MPIKKIIVSMLTLGSVFWAGWWIGTSRLASDASPPSFEKQISVQKSDVSRVIAVDKTKPNQVNKTVREMRALHNLNLLIKIQVGKVDELKSYALNDLQNYYLEFASSEELATEHDATRQIIISRIERVADRWPELGLCPISEGAIAPKRLPSSTLNPMSSVLGSED